MEEIRFNNTTLFLLPMAGVGGWDNIFTIGFKEAFLDDNGFDGDYRNCLFLLFEPLDEYNFEHYLTYHLKKLPNYATDYKVDEFQRMVVMKIPMMYHESVKWFKKGKLSKMSGEYFKQQFSKDDSRYLAYIKHPSQRAYLEDQIGETLPDDAELWDIPTPDREIFRYNEELFSKKKW